VVNVKEKYFNTQYRPADILLNVNGMIYFKFGLQLKFRNNENYTSLIVNFHTCLLQKYSKLIIKI
jgi:hypothetical protein